MKILISAWSPHIFGVFSHFHIATWSTTIHFSIGPGLVRTHPHIGGGTCSLTSQNGPVDGSHDPGPFKRNTAQQLTYFVYSGASVEGCSHCSTFFATNYVAHAATVKSSPGEGSTTTAFMTLLALCFPMFGLLRALNAIARRARFGGSELRNACRAGALCMVVRGRDWRPDPRTELEAVLVEQILLEQEMSDNVEDRNLPKVAKMVNYFPSYAREDSSAWAYFDTIGSRAYVDPDLTRIHGSYHLSPGYTFAIVPRNAKLNCIKKGNPNHEEVAQEGAALKDSSPRAASGQLSVTESQPAPDSHSVSPESSVSVHSGRTTSNDAKSDASGKEGPLTSSPTKVTNERPLKSDISSNYGIVKAIASLIHLLGGLDTLILHREDAIERWGYAAFHLTVIPYMLMTTVNFVSNLLVADYACLYMVGSDAMREAEARGCKFTAIVGSLQGYQLQNHAEFSAIEVAGWNGFTQRHMANLARFLGGDLTNIEMILSTRFICVDTTQADNISLVQNEADRITTRELRAPSLEGDTHMDTIQPPSSQALDSSHYNREELVQASTPVGTTPHDGNEVDSTFSSRGSLSQAMVILETSEGRQFRVEAHTTLKLIDLSKWKSNLKSSKTLVMPSKPQKIDFPELMQIYINSLVLVLGAINPVYLKLLDAIEEVRNHLLGTKPGQHISACFSKSCTSRIGL